MTDKKRRLHHGHRRKNPKRGQRRPYRPVCPNGYGELGVDLSTAINVFLRQSLRTGGFSFKICLERPSKETISAMLEAERIARDPTVKRYSDVEEALSELKR